MSEPMQVDEASAPSIIDIKTSPQPQITDAPIPSLPPKPVQVVQEDAQVPQNGTNGTAETELRRGEPPAPAKKMCGVCKEQEMKYRCSKCELP